MSKRPNKLLLVLLAGVLAAAVVLAAGCESPIGGPQPLNDKELEESEVGQFPPTEESEAGKEHGAEAGKAEEEAGGHGSGTEPGGVEGEEAGGHAGEPAKSRREIKIEELLAKARGVPLEELEEHNPLRPTAANIEAGRQLYESHCVRCHGLGGYGDGESAGVMKPPPADLHEDYVQLQSDGALFYLISRGVPGTSMPSFRRELDERELWQTVTYIRTFAELTSPALVE